MPGIQLPIGIDTVNPVPADFKYGPYATVAAAKAAILLALRFDGLTVQITGLGNYWWLAADLSDAGLTPKTAGGNAPVPITYAALLALQTGAVLISGTMYKITDRDLGIYITAITPTEFSIDGVRTMLTPNQDIIINPNIHGTWSPYCDLIIPLTAGVSNIVWGGSVWLSTTGSVGTSVDDLTLDAVNWTLIPKGVAQDIYYRQITHNIEYELTLDLVIKQWDDLGNIVGAVTSSDVAALGYNPCTITDWLCFVDNSYVWVDNRYACYNNNFRLGCFNLDCVQPGVVTNAPVIRFNTIERLKNISLFPVGNVVFENNGNCDIYNNDLVIYLADNTDVQIHDNTTNNFTSLNISSVNGGGLIQNGTSNNVNLTSVNNSTLNQISNNNFTSQFYCFNSSGIDIVFCTGSDLIFTNNQTLSLQGNNYATAVNISDVAFRYAPYNLNIDTTEINKACYEVDGIVTQYLEFLGGFTIGVDKYLSSVLPANCRLVEAILVCSGLSVTNPLATMEFGIETSVLAYMPLTLNSTLNTTPQRITTISGVITTGKRFYVKAAVASTISSAAKIKVWVKLIRF